MPLSDQENGGGRGGGLAALAGCGAGIGSGKAAAPPTFRFRAPRALIDWRALHAVDVGGVVRDTDIDALEGVLDVVAFGDIEAEDARNLTPFNFIKLFRVAQLTVDYLLHVQDRLAADAGAVQGEAGRLQQREQLLTLKVREQREELAGARKEARHLKKSLRTFEVGAGATPACSTPAWSTLASDGAAWLCTALMLPAKHCLPQFHHNDILQQAPHSPHSPPVSLLLSGAGTCPPARAARGASGGQGCGGARPCGGSQGGEAGGGGGPADPGAPGAAEVRPRGWVGRLGVQG